MTSSNPASSSTSRAEIITILDRSGSMFSIKKDIIGSFNSFLTDQGSLPGEAKVTLIQFDDKIETVYQGVPIKDVAPLTNETFVPRGTTSLYDAIGTALSVQGERIKREAWADVVIVTILTDGAENSSTEYTAERVKEMTSHAETHGWKFIYLGANQDSFSVSRGLGIVGGTTVNFDASSLGVTQAYATMSATTRSYRGG